MLRRRKRMANVDNLKTSFKDLGREDAFALLINIRQNRRNVLETKSKRRSTKKSSTGGKKKTKKKDIAALVSNMSPEQAQLLLKQLKTQQ